MRSLEVNVNRERDYRKTLERLKEKKNCRTDKTRVRNKIEQVIMEAWKMLEEGVLVDDGKKVAIRTLEEFREYIELIKDNGIFALDLETTGFCPYRDYLVGVCLYTPNPEEKRVYIPINHTDINNVRKEGQLTEEEIREGMVEILHEAKVVTHYGKIEGKFINRKLGINIEDYYFDTHLASCVLNENESHELKDLYDKYVLRGSGNSNSDYGSLFGKDFPFNYLPIEIAKIYGADDGYKTYKLYEFQAKYLENPKRKDLKQLSTILFEIEMKLIPVVVEMELRGVELDIEEAKNLEEIFIKEIEQVEGRLDEFVRSKAERIKEHPDLMRLMKLKDGEDVKINFSSPQQVASFLYDVLKLKSPSKKKPRGTGKNEIEILKRLYPKGSYFFNDFLEYKGLVKLLNTYIRKLPNVINPITGVLHGQFNIYGARTGRFSSSDPNLQNIPRREKRIRRIFIAREGHYFNCSDYSQIEPRILASLPQIDGLQEEDGLMKRAYKEGKDLYAYLASIIFNMDYENCSGDSEERQTTKGVLLGIMYGRTPESIAEEFEKPVTWGRQIVNLFYDNFPEVKLVMEYTLYHGIQKGYVTTILGRKRRLEDLQLDEDNWKFQEAQRRALNSRIQGTSADITKLAMIRIYNNERLKELGVYQLITVHDEIITEIPEENIVEASRIIKEEMEEAGRIVLGDIPVKVDTDIVKKWYGENYNEYLEVA